MAPHSGSSARAPDGGGEGSLLSRTPSAGFTAFSFSATAEPAQYLELGECGAVSISGAHGAREVLDFGVRQS